MFTLEHTCLKKGSLAGEVAVITGATSNVGRGYAQALAWAGAKVAVVGRNEQRGAAVIEEINRDNGEGTAIFVRADVSEKADIDKIKEQTLAAFGKVDILINNAMDMALCGPILGSKIEDLDQSYAISARAVMLAANAFVPDMVKRGHGAVVYSSTQFDFFPNMLGGSIYTAGKAAATSAMMSLAAEIEGSGVNVFCLCPAGVGAVAPASVKNAEEVEKSISMPGFPGLIPASAAGAGLVYCILRASELNGSGLIITDVLSEMDYPFPVPETARRMDAPRHDKFATTMFFCYMGPGFQKK